LPHWLTHPSLAGHVPGSEEWFAAQRRMIAVKPLVENCYRLWYRLLLEDADSAPPGGIIVELGSGSSFLKQLRPETVTSDVVEGNADLVFDGRRLPFRAASVRALLLTHVFHHIPDVGAFLSECERVLIPGGVVSIVDCAHTPFSRFFFGKIHPEPYNWRRQPWDFPEGKTLFDSNQALTWMVFVRDRMRFEREFPRLRIEARTWLPWFGYLCSGGVNLRSLVPGPLVPAFRILDRLSRPLDPLCAIHWHWTLRRSA